MVLLHVQGRFLQSWQFEGAHEIHKFTWLRCYGMLPVPLCANNERKTWETYEITWGQIHMSSLQKKISTKPRLERHMKLHNDDREEAKRFICYICRKSFDRDDSLNAHMNIHQQQFKPYVCYICRFDTKLKNSLSVHMKKIHELESKSYFCRECNRLFENAATFQCHQERVHGKPPKWFNITSV